MLVPTLCTRHARTARTSYCPACTAWHLAVKIARHDGLDSTPSPDRYGVHVPYSRTSQAPVGTPLDLTA